MKDYHLQKRNWYIIGGKPRPLARFNNQYVCTPLSTEHPHCIKFYRWLIEPLRINKELIEHSNLRNMSNDEENYYDSLWFKYETITLPFIIKFDYEVDEPCEIIFPLGDKIKIKYIHRLQQFVYAITREELRIRMNY